MEETGTDEVNKPNFTPIFIRSEADAIALLTETLEGKAPPENAKLIFDGWPVYSLHVEGGDWHSSVPTRIMPPLIDLQRDLQRAYAQVRYGESNLRRLTELERERLEVVVEVREGSSDFQAKLQEILTHIADVAMTKMEAKHIVQTVLGIALIWGTHDVGKAYIAQRQSAQQAADQANATLQLSREETKRLQLIAEAARREPYVAEVRTQAEDSTNKMLRTLKPEDQLTVGGDKLPGTQAQQIVKEARAVSHDIMIDGLFRVLLVDTTSDVGFKVKVARHGDGMEFMAIVPLELNPEQKDLIQKAEWSKSLVYLNVDATQLRDKIVDAYVLSAKPLSTVANNSATQ